MPIETFPVSADHPSWVKKTSAAQNGKASSKPLVMGSIDFAEHTALFAHTQSQMKE